MRCRSSAAAVLLVLSIVCRAALAADSAVSSATDPDFAIQGEYAGAVEAADGELPVGVQVIALGEGKFHAVGYLGGLPGDGWDGHTKVEADGKSVDGVTRFGTEEYRGEIKQGALRILGPDNKAIAEMKKVQRAGPTLGARPPAGAVVLFDGRNADQFSPGRMTDDGLLMQGAATKRKFQGCQLHVEFQLPFMPAARGQGRGNSGVYLQGRYEVQMLDSFGLSGENNECGGIYSIKAPDVNMCYPPLAWQTYDIDYTAAMFADGKKTKDAAMTVRHNGVVVHKDVALPHTTTAAPVAEGPEPGPVFLQDHGTPVRYRNLWLVEKP